MDLFDKKEKICFVVEMGSIRCTKVRRASSREYAEWRFPDSRHFPGNPAMVALFSSEIFWEIDTVAFLFVFDKYCPIMN